MVLDNDEEVQTRRSCRRIQRKDWSHLLRANPDEHEGREACRLKSDVKKELVTKCGAKGDSSSIANPLFKSEIKAEDELIPKQPMKEPGVPLDLSRSADLLVCPSSDVNKISPSLKRRYNKSPGRTPENKKQYHSLLSTFIGAPGREEITSREMGQSTLAFKEPEKSLLFRETAQDLMINNELSDYRHDDSDILSYRYFIYLLP